MAGNRVFLNQDGLIEIAVVGGQDLTSIERMGREVNTLITQQKAVGQPALVLDNLLDIGPVDSSGRKLVVELGKRLDYDRLALLGKQGVAMRLGANLMLRAVGKAYKVRYFEDREKAVAWLKEKALT